MSYSRRSLLLAACLAAAAGCDRTADRGMSYDAMPRLTLTPQGLVVVTNSLGAPGKNAVTVLDTRTWKVKSQRARRS